MSIIFLLFFLLSYTNCIEIKLALGAQLPSGNYPLMVTLIEPLIYERNPIDLFCVYDISTSMRGDRLTNLKATLNLIIKALESDDRLCLINFSDDGNLVKPLTNMDEVQKEIFTKYVSGITLSGATNFDNAIKRFLENIKKTYQPQNGRVQSIIFITDGEDNYSRDAKNLFLNQMKNYKDKNYDFTIHTFGLGSQVKSESLINLADCRDGSFYYIDKYANLQDYVLNTIGSLRTTAFKLVDLELESPFPIVKLYESHRINNTLDKNPNLFHIYNLQFMTGHEYTYMLEIKIPESTKVGENVLKANVKYEDFKGHIYQDFNYLDFYHAIGCFNCYREEYCRCLAVEAIENVAKNNKAPSVEFNKVRTECGKDLNQNISIALDYIEQNPSLKIYMYGIISEASFKKSGMNLWYSNEYQNELINEYLDKEDHRYIWERFHVPYWKLPFLRRIHRALGIPVQFIYILFITALCIPLTFISTFACRGVGRLIFNMIAGLIIQIALFDVAFLNVFISCCVVYLLLRFTKIHGGPILFMLFGYLMIVHGFHLYFYGQTLDFGASPFLFMFAIAKITFFTYAVRERKVNPSVFINQYHRYCITDEKFPNFLEFLSYIYFFPSAIYGPSFQIKDYLNYVYERDEYKHIKIKWQILQGTIRIIAGYGLIALYYFLKYNQFWQFGMFKIYEYLASDDCLSINLGFRFLLIYAWSIYIKFFIYGFFQLIYGIFMLTGIAYSEEVVLTNYKGGEDYILDVSDKKGHCGRILKSDFGYNFGEALNHFNRSIHIYLKYCVYIRILFLKRSWIKNYFIAAIFVFIFAALWCGIYIGSYFFFAAACVIYQCHFNLELMGFYDWLDHANIVIKILMTIPVQYVMSMIYCMLFLYKLDMILCYLRNYYFTPIVVVAVLYVISLLLRIFKFKIKIPEKKTRGRSKTRSKKVKKEPLL